MRATASRREPKGKRRLARLFSVAALFLFSICIRVAFAGDIKPYSRDEFNKLAAEGKPILGSAMLLIAVAAISGRGRQRHGRQSFPGVANKSYDAFLIL